MRYGETCYLLYYYLFEGVSLGDIVTTIKIIDQILNERNQSIFMALSLFIPTGTNRNICLMRHKLNIAISIAEGLSSLVFEMTSE